MAKTIITITKTVQVAQYEPLIMSITEEHDKLLDEEAKNKRMVKLGAQLRETMSSEVRRWKKDAKND